MPFVISQMDVIARDCGGLVTFCKKLEQEREIKRWIVFIPVSRIDRVKETNEKM